MFRINRRAETLPAFGNGNGHGRSNGKPRQYVRAGASDLQLARDAVCAAGAAIRPLFVAAPVKRNGRAPELEAMRVSHAVMADVLRSVRPRDRRVSAAEPPAELSAESPRYWLIEPLDGIAEFAAGVSEFSVMLALVEKGTVRIAAIYRPVEDVLLYAARGQGAFMIADGVERPLKAREPQLPVRASTSPFHAEPILLDLCLHLGAVIAPVGSIGVKCGLIAAGARDLYIHPVPETPKWITAAPDLILREAGAKVSDCLGAPLRYDDDGHVHPCGFLAAAPGVHRKVVDYLRERVRTAI